MPRSISYSTLGDHIDAGHEITVYCERFVPGKGVCGHFNRLNLEALAEKLGRDHSALAGALSKKLKCKECGGKQMSFNLSVRAGWDGTGGHSHGGRRKTR